MINKGININLLTPFTDTNEIDFESLERQIEIYISNGAKSIIVGRGFGEFLTMDDDEIISVIEFVVGKVSKRVPVIVQTGFNDTIRSIKLSIKAKSTGVDALILLPPYFSNGNEKGIYNHFKSISVSVGLPCYIENDFEKSGVDLVQYIDTLSSINNIVGIIENSSDITKYTKIIANTNDSFEIICANDAIILPTLSLGVTSFISAIANICPDDIKTILDYYNNGEISKARDKYIGILEIHEVFNQEILPVPIKTAMNMLGYNVGDFRLPLGSMNPDKAARLATLLMDQNIKMLEK